MKDFHQALKQQMQLEVDVWIEMEYLMADENNSGQISWVKFNEAMKSRGRGPRYTWSFPIIL